MTETNPYESPVESQTPTTDEGSRHISSLHVCSIAVLILGICFGISAAGRMLRGGGEVLTLLSPTSNSGSRIPALDSVDHYLNSSDSSFVRAVSQFLAGCAVAAFAFALLRYAKHLRLAACGELVIEQTINSQKTCWILALALVVGRFIVLYVFRFYWLY